MKTYELSYIISPDVTSEEAEAKAKEFEAAILAREGTVLKQLNPVAKSLSYPIAKRASGFLGVMEFQLEPEKLVELEELISKDGKIVRHIVIIKEATEMKKERRTRKVASEEKFAPEFKIEKKVEETTETKNSEEVKEEKPAESKTQDKATKEKVELKDIEQELDEILK